MTALAKGVPSFQRSAAADAHPAEGGFLRFLPAVKKHAEITFRQLSEVEKEEAVAEAIATAYCNYASAARRRRTDALKPSMLATYAAWHVKDGRHVGGGRDRTRDVLSRRAAQRRQFKVHRLCGREHCIYDCLALNDHPVWRRVLLEDRRTPVPDQVAFRIDWSAFLSRQTDRTRRMLAMLAEGHRRCQVADKFGVTAPALTQRMDRLRRQWLAFQDPTTNTTRRQRPVCRPVETPRLEPRRTVESITTTPEAA
jgi:hypothetical protein